MKQQSISPAGRQGTERAAIGVLQRKCACGQHAAGGDCEECRKKTESLQRSPSREVEPATVPRIVREVLASSGKPLEAPVRSAMESRFEQDFSQVRVHTGPKAAQSARAVSALAYTVGSNIVFDLGGYAPETRSGKGLLAHELSHVVQQGGRDAVPANLSIGPEGSAAEREAEAAARSVMSGMPGPKLGAVGSSQVQRLPNFLESFLGSEELEDLEAGETEEDAQEVHDGDDPVSAGGGGGGLLAGLGLGDLLAFAGEGEEEQILLAENEGGAKPAQDDATSAKKDAKPAPQKPAKAKPRKITHIFVDQASQKMTLTWSDGTVDKPVDVSTGKGRPNTKDDPCKTQKEKNCTPNGTFTVGVLGDGSTKNQHGDAMSWYVEFVPGRSIGIHNSQPVVSGTPLSHGCVRVGKGKAADAFAKLINQSVISGQTTVEVTGKAPTKPYTKATKKKKK